MALAFGFASGAVAHAGPKECAEISEKAQQLRSDSRLVGARDLFTMCAKPECPAVVRSDCAQQRDDAEAALPSLVIAVRDANGTDIPRSVAHVFVDDVEAASALDGLAVEVDPGPHALRVETAGLSPVTQSVVAREGEKRREIAFTLPGVFRPSPAPVAVAPVAAAPVTPAPPVPDKPKPPAGPPASPVPWVVFGVGAVTLAAGVVLVVVAGQMDSTAKNQCTSDSVFYGKLTCQAGVDTAAAQSQYNQASDVGVVGLVTMGGGLLVGAAGLIAHFVEMGHKRHAGAKAGVAVSPWLGQGTGGVVLGGAF